MEEKLKKLFKEINSILNLAPVDEDCTEEELIMYSDMSKLYESLFDAGYHD